MNMPTAIFLQAICYDASGELQWSFDITLLKGQSEQTFKIVNYNAQTDHRCSLFLLWFTKDENSKMNNLGLN